jgi:hypothetical protein
VEIAGVVHASRKPHRWGSIPRHTVTKIGKGEKRMSKIRMSKIPNPTYKCTYTSLEGAPCPVMGIFGYKQPHPSHCHAYDMEIWKINPKKTCEYCIPLEPDEIPKKKIWCNDMDRCDSYNDGGIEKCENCLGGTVVFDLPKGKVKQEMATNKKKTLAGVPATSACGKEVLLFPTLPKKEMTLADANLILDGYRKALKAVQVNGTSMVVIDALTELVIDARTKRHDILKSRGEKC